jgi:DNA-binding transcriptional LysR family regulator
MWPTGAYDFPGVLGAFHERHAGVEIHVVEDTADALLAMLRADELDCAFASVDPDGLGEEFSAVLLYEEQLVVACAEGHPFCAQDHVTFAELAGEALVGYREGSALRRRLERAMAAEGLVPRTALICTEMAAVRALASRGLGVAVLPASIAAVAGPPVVARQLGAEPLTWPVALAWRAARRQPAAAAAFLALALDGAGAGARTPPPPPPRLRVA